MNFELVGWKCEGLRCPDVNISFKRNGSAAGISLVQMPNGTGKTTTLDLLRAALTGSAVHWDEERVRDLRRTGTSNTSGYFEVMLSVDDHPLNFRLNVDLEDGRISYKTSSPLIGGVEQEWKPPPDIRRFLRSKFIELFIFNGELAKDLLTAEKSAAEDSIDALCQLDLLDRISDHANAHWETQTNKGGPKTEKGLKGAQTNLKKIQTKLKQQRTELKEAEEKINKLTTRINELEELRDNTFQGNEEKRADYEQAVEARNKWKTKVASLSLALIASLRRPENISNAVSGGLEFLRSNLSTLQLPGSTSKQFFEELKQEENCVCGRPMDDQAKQVIEQSAQNYMGEEFSGILNSLKGDISKYASSKEPGAETEVAAIETELRTATDNLQQAKNSCELLRKEMTETGGKEFQNMMNELSNKEGVRDDLLSLCKDLKDPNLEDTDKDDLPESIPVLEKEEKNAKKKVDDIAETVELGEKTELIHKILARSKSVAREKIRLSIKETCNQRISQVLKSDPIEIADIGRSIALRGQRGASEGQTLAVGYTFLTTVLNRGNHKFPLVVDSPAIPISKQVRREVAQLIPELCHQFVGLTISSERAGFIEALEKVSSGKIRFLTVFRRTEGTREQEKALPKRVSEFTETGVVVDQRNYFFEFEDEEESE